MSNKILVIGAENIDIFSSSKEDYILHDSNMSKITLGFGGVGGNIASNLANLGADVSFMTVFGDDMFSIIAYNHFAELGINLETSMTIPHESNSIYLAIMDKENDLYLGLNDMDIINHLNVEYFKAKSTYIEQFSIIVIDNNLSIEAITYLLKTYRHKTIIMDAVSAVKVHKLRKLLKYITILKVNALELSVLSKEGEMADQITDVMNEGLKELLVTNKGEDVYYFSQTETLKVKPYECTNIVNATGAGDAFISGFTYGLSKGYNNPKKLEEALKLAHKTLGVASSTIEKVK